VTTLRSSAWFTDELAVVSDDHVILEMLTRSGRTAVVEFLVRLDRVEVWHDHHLSGDFDREVLRRWLAAPDDPLSADDVVLDLDYGLDRAINVYDRQAITVVPERVAVSVDDINAWPLPLEALDSLRSLV
jgi:hypothetical protein